MFIPSYQIHNILKDFTLQLKKKRQSLPPEAGRAVNTPAPAPGPGQLRLASVVDKVAENIMRRIANLGREAGGVEGKGASPSVTTGRSIRTNPACFDYHLMDRNGGKVKKRLVFKDSRSLVERFQHLTAADGNAGGDQG